MVPRKLLGKCWRLQHCLCQGGCKVLFLQAYRVRLLVSWFDLCALSYFLPLFPGPYRAGVSGRLVPVGSDCASWRRAVSRGSAHPRLGTWVGVGSGVWPELSVEEAIRRRAGVGREAFRSERRARVRSGRRSFSARPSGRRLDCPSVLSF